MVGFYAGLPRRMSKTMTISMLEQMLFTLNCGHEVVIGRLEHAETWKCEECKKLNDLRLEPRNVALAKDLEAARQIDLQAENRGQIITRLG